VKVGKAEWRGEQRGGERREQRGGQRGEQRGKQGGEQRGKQRGEGRAEQRGEQRGEQLARRARASKLYCQDTYLCNSSFVFAFTEKKSP
jgi:hypothetical protein